MFHRPVLRFHAAGSWQMAWIEPASIVFRPPFYNAFRIVEPEVVKVYLRWFAARQRLKERFKKRLLVGAAYGFGSVKSSIFTVSSVLSALTAFVHFLLKAVGVRR